ncbi:unknown [Akkermansia sp. CAG:344]|nr:unknown [Akkermansia sp. CAG:344]
MKGKRAAALDGAGGKAAGIVNGEGGSAADVQVRAFAAVRQVSHDGITVDIQNHAFRRACQHHMVEVAAITVQGERAAFHAEGVRHKGAVDRELARVLLDEGDPVFPNDAAAHDGVRPGIIIRCGQSRFQAFVVEDDNGVASVRIGVFHLQRASRCAQQVVDDRAVAVGIAGGSRQLDGKRLALGDHHAGVHAQRSVVRDRIGIRGGGAVHHVKAVDLSAEDQAAAVGARHADAVVGKDFAELDVAQIGAFQRSGRQRQPAFHPGVLMGDEGVHNGVNIQIDRGGIIDDELAVSLVNDGRTGRSLVDVVRAQGKVQRFRSSRTHRNVSGDVGELASGSQGDAFQHVAIGAPQVDGGGGVHHDARGGAFSPRHGGGQ